MTSRITCAVITALAMSLSVRAATCAAPLMTPEPLPPRLTLQELRQKYARPEDHTITIDGVEVVYRDEGKGPALLLFHGSNSTMRTYDGVVARLRNRYRLIRYDIPPNGLSGPIPDAVVGRLRPSDVAARILETVGVKRVTAVGVSSGGTTAIFLAAEHPELVDRLILSNAPSDPVDMGVLKRSPALEQAEAMYGGYLDATRVKPRSYWRIYWDFYSGAPGRISDRSVDEMYDFSRRTVEANAKALTGVVAKPAKAVAAMNAVHVPVLLLWGGADPLLPAPAAPQALARHLTNAQISMLIVPDASHYPSLEIPDRFAAIVTDYIEQVMPKP